MSAEGAPGAHVKKPRLREGRGSPEGTWADLGLEPGPHPLQTEPQAEGLDVPGGVPVLRSPLMLPNVHCEE